MNDEAVHLREMERQWRELDREESKVIEAKVEAVIDGLMREDVGELWPQASDDLTTALENMSELSPSHQLVAAALQLDSSKRSKPAGFRSHNMAGEVTTFSPSEKRLQYAEEGTVDEEDPLADICTLLQSAGENGVDLRHWLSHYDKTGTGVLKKKDLRKAVISLGQGVLSEDDNSVDRLLSRDAFNSLVDYLGGRADADIVPYARLLTMVPSMGMPKRESPPRAPQQGSPSPPDPPAAKAIVTTSKSSKGCKVSALASRSSARASREVEALKALPPDMRATIGQNRARERVRQRALAERAAARKKESNEAKKQALREKKLCDAVSLTAKMQRVTARRRKKKEDKKAKARSMQLALQDNSQLEDLLQSRLSAETTFGDFLKSLKIRNHAGLATIRRNISGKALTRIIGDITGLDLPRSALQTVMAGAIECMREDSDSKRARRSNPSIELKKWSPSTKLPVECVEKYFRRIRCKTRIEYRKWARKKGADSSNTLKTLSSKVEKALAGDIGSLRDIQNTVVLLEKAAKNALGEGEGSGSGAKYSISGGNPGSTNDTNANAPSTREVLRVRRELQLRKIIPKWQVKAIAEDTTENWLSSLEGRAAVRHAAWAQSNAGRALDKAVEPDASALAKALSKLREDRLSNLIGDSDALPSDGSEPINSTGPSAFYEMLSHKLFGEFLREMLANSEEWLKQNERNTIKSWPKRPFDEWIQRRHEQTHRNKETVVKWRRHKSAQFAKEKSYIRRVAIVDDVIQRIKELESMCYQEVLCGKTMKTRKAARSGLNVRVCISQIRKFGKSNSSAIAISDSTASGPSGPSRSRRKKKAADKGNSVPDWITFRQFLSVMEQPLFSLKDYPPPAASASCLLRGELDNGKDLFVVNQGAPNSIPDIVLDRKSNLARANDERDEAFDKWAQQKNNLRKKEARILAKARMKERQKKSKLKKESEKAVKIWKKTIDKRQPQPRFKPRASWTDVYAPPIEQEEWDARM